MTHYAQTLFSINRFMAVAICWLPPNRQTVAFHEVQLQTDLRRSPRIKGDFDQVACSFQILKSLSSKALPPSTTVTVELSIHLKGNSFEKRFS